MVQAEVQLLPPCEGEGVGRYSRGTALGGNKIWCKPKVVPIKGYYFGDHILCHTFNLFITALAVTSSAVTASLASTAATVSHPTAEHGAIGADD